MQAYLYLLRLDMEQLARSWLVRIWILLLVGPAGFFVVVAANQRETRLGDAGRLRGGRAGAALLAGGRGALRERGQR